MRTIRDKHRGLTAAKLRRLLSYDPISGAFYWKDGTGQRGRTGKQPAGKRAGWISKGRRRIQLPGYSDAFLTSRLAWLYMTGKWPPRLIDHKNRNKSDDSWNNLELSNNSRNQLNRGLRPQNSSGVTGVSGSGNDWLAELSVDGRRVLRKRVTTKQEAIRLRQQAEVKYLGQLIQP